MHAPTLFRRTASVAAVGLVLAACGPRFDPAEIANQPGTTTVEVPLAGGGTASTGGGGTGAPTTGTDGTGTATGTPSNDQTTTGTGTTPGGSATGGGAGSGAGSTGDQGGGDPDPGGGDGGGDGGDGGGSTGDVDPGPAPGVTDEPCVMQREQDQQYVNEDLGCIYIGVLVPETGAAPVPSDFRSGVSLYWYEKAEAGGTHGRQVALYIEDTASNTDQTVEKAKALLERGMFTLVSLDRLEVHQSLGDFMEAAGVPHIMVQAPTPYPSNWVNSYVISIDHTHQGRAVAEYWATDLGAADGARKVGVIREQTAALKPGVDAFEARARDFGLDVAIVETINPNDQTFTSTVLNICDSGAEIVWLYMAPTPAINIMQTAQGQPTCDVTWFANSISWNLDLAQANPNAPAKSHAFSPWVSVQSARAADYRAAFQKYNNAAADDLGLASWGLSEVVDSALEATGPNLGRTSFRTAMENLRVDSYDTWGPIDCTNGPVCSRHVAVYDDNQTTWKMVGDFRTFE